MSEELKPCAHCGNAEIKPLHECNSNKPLYRVKCYKCGMQTHLDDKDKVIAAWNTRHEPDELPEWAKHEINMHYSVAAKESSEIIRELNKNSPVAVGDPYFSGYLAALRWVLSLRKPEVKE